VNRELAQLIALAAHGRDWLAAGDDGSAQATEGNSTFQHVQKLKFLHPRNRLGRRVVTRGVHGWLAQLRTTGASRVWLAIPDTTGSSASTGAAWWTVVAEGPHGSEVWEARWAMTKSDPASPERTACWSVTYKGARSAARSPRRPAIPVARQALTEAVTRAQELAREISALSRWDGWFGEALGHPESIPYYPDLLPASASDEARHLMAMAVKAWVFGGMSSWSDVSIDNLVDQARYNRVSEALYQAVLDGLLAATND
jgi:hypothetical protein